MLGRSLLLLLPWLLGGCTDAWEVFPAERPPDMQCRTGGDGGHDVYIWECEEEPERVVVHQFCTGLMGCDAPERETAACGQETAFERDLEDACAPMPAVRRWPGS